MTRSLVVMVKVPEAGRVKTRLGRDIGAIGAVQFYRHTTRAVLARIDRPREWRTLLALSPDHGLSSRAFPAHIARMPQGSGSLGTRMQRVIDNPALTKLPEDAQAAVAKLRASLENPDLERSLAGMQRAIARLERLLVGRESDIATTLENLRLITDNLRDTSELAKRHPSQIFLGGPPAASSVTTSP